MCLYLVSCELSSLLFITVISTIRFVLKSFELIKTVYRIIREGGGWFRGLWNSLKSRRAPSSFLHGLLSINQRRRSNSEIKRDSFIRTKVHFRIEISASGRDTFISERSRTRKYIFDPLTRLKFFLRAFNRYVSNVQLRRFQVRTQSTVKYKHSTRYMYFFQKRSLS